MTATALAAAECEANTCGHVDTDVADHHAHGGMTPHDWEALQAAVQHALGLRTGPGNCSVCHYATEAATPRCDRCGSTRLTRCVQYGRRDQGLPQDPGTRWVCGCGGSTVTA